MPNPGAEWWTVADVAAHIGAKESTVRAYVASVARGQSAGIPQPRRIGRTPVWKPADIIAWHANRPGPGRRKSA